MELIILIKAKVSKTGYHYNNLYKCYCGNEFEARPYKIETGHTNSCGCYGKEQTSKARKTHGMSTINEYKIWKGIKYRCYSETCPGYKYYGGRGITMCDRWKNSFEAFYADMGPRPKGLSIDRTNNDGDYEPSNCTWATRSQQVRNRRKKVA